MVFFISHNLPLFCKLVVVATKMKYAVDHNSVYFIFKGLLVFFSIFFNPVSTHINLANYLVSNGIVKCYDVCIGVVIKKFFVDFKNVVVIAKNKRDISNLARLFCRYSLNAGCDRQPLSLVKMYQQSKKKCLTPSFVNQCFENTLLPCLYNMVLALLELF